MKTKAITKMMTALLLTLVFVALPLSPVPTRVSAMKLKFNEVLDPPSWTWPDDYWPALQYRSIQPQARSADWAGPLTGGITAKAYFWETEKNFVTGAKGGKVEHFFEDFLIVFADGGWVIGRETQGIFTFAAKPTSAKYHAEGPITSASSDKTSFIGCKFTEEGIVAPWDDPTHPDTAWWYGIGTGSITP
jgi:hypothetical protein